MRNRTAKNTALTAYYLVYAWIYWGFATYESANPEIFRYSKNYFLFLLVATLPFFLPACLDLLPKGPRAKKTALLTIGVLAAIHLALQQRYYLQQRHAFDPFLQNALPNLSEWSREKAPGTFRIAALGGSTTENDALPPTDRYPAQLQKLLGERNPGATVEVMNAGKAWYTSKHTLINYSVHVRDWNPDLLVVMHAVNDLVRSFDDNEWTMGPYNDAWSHFYGPAVQGAWPPPYEVYLLRRLSLPSRFSAWRFKSRFKEKDLPLSAYRSLPAFEGYMRKILRTAAGDGVAALVVTQPYLFKDGMSRDERNALKFARLFCVRRVGFGRYEYPSVKSLERAMAAFDRTARELARKEGVPVVDAEARLDKSLEFFADDVHYTAAGARKMAELVAEGVEKTKAFQQAKGGR